MGGGGDGGFGERQAAQDKSRAEARAAINALFGISTPAPSVAPSAPAQRQGTMNRYQMNRERLLGPGAGEPEAPQEEGRQSIPFQPSDEAATNKAGLETLYGKIRGDAFNAGLRGLDEQKSDADRRLKFELAARGTRGGSADRDANARLFRAYNQGRMDLGTRADSIATNMRANDEQTRINLLQGIESGIDQGTAVSSALNQMRTNADRAQQEAQGGVFGNMLGSAADIYAGNQRARGQQQGQQWWQTNRPAPSRPSGVTITPTSGRG